MIRPATLATLLSLIAAPSSAEGFRVGDLNWVQPEGGLFDATAVMGDRDAGRASILCDGCADIQALDIVLGRNDDGTEDRYRAGQTTIADLEARCRDSNASCRMRAVEIGGAVGWRSAWDAGGFSSATAVLLQDGDLLTMRAIGTDAATADAILDRGLAAYGARIVAP